MEFITNEPIFQANNCIFMIYTMVFLLVLKFGSQSKGKYLFFCLLVNDLKKMWDNLKTVYKKKVNQEEENRTTSGQAAKAKKPITWPFYEDLAFLKKFTKTKSVYVVLISECTLLILVSELKF